MKKKFNLGNSEFLSFQSCPLVADDVNVYELVYTANCDLAGSSVMVTAFRADGSTVQDMGIVSGNKATALLKTNMYEQVGELRVRLSVIDENGSCLTTKEIVFNVVEGNGNDSIKGSDNYPVLVSLIAEVKELQSANNANKLRNYAKTVADTAEKNAKAYTDEKAESTLNDAKAYADEVLISATEYTNKAVGNPSVTIEGDFLTEPANLPQHRGIAKITIEPLFTERENQIMVTLGDEGFYNTMGYCNLGSGFLEGSRIVIDAIDGSAVHYEPTGEPFDIDIPSDFYDAMRDVDTRFIMLSDTYALMYNCSLVYKCSAQDYTDSKIGDIDKALDEIHAYAESLKNGGIS